MREYLGLFKRKENNEHEFRRQCYHEAGHALVAWWQGLQVESVYPQIASRRAGIITFVQRPTLIGRTRLGDMFQRCRLTEKRVRICLAGRIAEVETGLVGLDEVYLHADFQAAKSLLSRVAPDRAARDAMMEAMYEQTTFFINQRLPQLTRLAELLLKDEYLDADDMGEMLGNPRMVFDGIRPAL
jgi:ATP-dependent Zn protease